MEQSSSLDKHSEGMMAFYYFIITNSVIFNVQIIVFTEIALGKYKVWCLLKCCHLGISQSSLSQHGFPSKHWSCGK